MTQTDQTLNRIIAQVLFVGLALAVALMLIGLGLSVLYPVTAPAHVTPLADLPGALLRGEALAYLSLGILLLVATPALRVLVLLVGNLRRRQWLFVTTAVLVLGILAVGVVLGLRG